MKNYTTKYITEKSEEKGLLFKQEDNKMSLSFHNGVHSAMVEFIDNNMSLKFSQSVIDMVDSVVLRELTKRAESILKIIKEDMPAVILLDGLDRLISALSMIKSETSISHIKMHNLLRCAC